MLPAFLQTPATAPAPPPGPPAHELSPTTPAPFWTTLGSPGPPPCHWRSPVLPELSSIVCPPTESSSLATCRSLSASCTHHRSFPGLPPTLLPVPNIRSASEGTHDILSMHLPL